jgi:GcrA cell cycle regulator
MNKVVHWTPRIDARLRELHATTMTFLEIATKMNAEFGFALTRNACIGRSRRIGLTLRAIAPVRKKQKVTPKARPYRKKIKPVAPPIVPEPPAFVPGRLTMLQLNHTTCRWPSGVKPPYTYCGEPIHDDRPFCLEHCRLAYQKPEKTWS